MSQNNNSKPATRGGIQGKIIIKEVFEPNPIQEHKGKKAPKWLILGLVVVLLIIGIIVVDLFFNLVYQVSIKIEQDPTPISPTVLLLVCVMIPVGVWRLVKPPPDRLPLSFLVLIGTVLFSFHFHWGFWLVGSLIATASIVPPTIKRLWKLQSLFKWAFRALLLVGSGLFFLVIGNIVLNLGFQGFLELRINIIETMLSIWYAFAEPLNWWHIITSVSAMISLRQFLGMLIRGGVDKLSK